MKTEYSLEFSEFWKIYPRKKNVSKFMAYRSWQKVTADSISIDDLQFAVECFAEEKKGWEERMIPHPATWLNQKRWETLAAFKGRPVEYPENFVKLWNMYPNKNGSMMKAYHVCRKIDEVTYEFLWNAVQKYADGLKATERDYVPHLSRWLREKMWETA